MRCYARTASLVLIAALLATWNNHRSKHPQFGIPVLLARTCPWQESFKQIGDDRLIVVTQDAQNGLKINETPFDGHGLQDQLTAIYATRNERLAWFDGDRAISYGNALRTLNGIYEIQDHPDTVLITSSEKTAYSYGFATQPRTGPCPYRR